MKPLEKILVKKYLLSVMIVAAFLPVFGQVAVNTDGSDADPSAIVDIKSNSRGFLPPRMSKGKRDAIPHPAEGLTVYDTTLKSLDFYNGEKWISLSKGGVFPEDTNVFQIAIGSAKADVAKTIITTPDGGFLVGGYTKYWSQNDSANMLLVKLNAQADFDRYGIPYGIYYQGHDERVESLCNISGSGYLAAATDKDVNGEQQIHLYWFTPNRHLDKTYGYFKDGSIVITSNDKIEISSAIQTSGGIFVYAGLADTVDNENNPDALAMKSDSSGCVVGGPVYVGGQGFDIFNQIIETADGHFVAVGSTYSYDNSSANMLIVKFNSDLSFDNTFGNNGIVVFGTNSNYTLAESVAEAGGGSIIVAGETNAFGAGSYDACFVKLRPDGTPDKNFGTNGVLTVGGSNGENISKIIKTKDGNFVAAGYEYTYSWGLYFGDMYLVKITPEGELVQGFGYNGSGAVAIGSSSDDCAYDIVELPSGNLVLAGYTYGFGSGNSDMYLVKVSPYGEVCSNAKAAGITTGGGGSFLTPALNTGHDNIFQSSYGIYKVTSFINITNICH